MFLFQQWPKITVAEKLGTWKVHSIILPYVTPDKTVNFSLIGVYSSKYRVSTERIKIVLLSQNIVRLYHYMSYSCTVKARVV